MKKQRFLDLLTQEITEIYKKCEQKQQLPFEDQEVLCFAFSVFTIPPEYAPFIEDNTLLDVWVSCANNRPDQKDARLQFIDRIYLSKYASLWARTFPEDMEIMFERAIAFGRPSEWEGIDVWLDEHIAGRSGVPHRLSIEQRADLLDRAIDRFSVKSWDRYFTSDREILRNRYPELFPEEQQDGTTSE